MKTIPVRHLKISQKEPNLSGDFMIKNLQELLNGKDMVHELHRHDFYFFLALKKGTGNHEIDFVNYDVTGHTIFIIRPGQVHELELKSNSEGFMIQFNTDFYYPFDKRMNSLLQKVSASNYYQLEEGLFSKINLLLASIFLEYKNKAEAYKEVIKSNLHILFIELLRSRNTNNKDSNTKDLYIQESLEKFLHLLETNITKIKQVSKYASMLNLSNYQLNTITKQTLGKTASEIINEQIILESKRYLLASSNQINQIAYYLGYEDVSYFIRFFKKHTGYSPEAFRKKLT
ncbi:AraC family transcriptional regulator [Tenacibaculum singaporense]|uniref:AraC family transcriptional regulator n=1 Tax=Tenacibaculum singaporense TaxID=2358479 RepID=UPI000F67D94A|nr:helix-turn-helix domain-containing protein [Tenacibaculum singaporense]RSC93510.1 helix-turn-helix domain-containing protein [Tenacibaculum singaporense]